MRKNRGGPILLFSLVVSLGAFSNLSYSQSHALFRDQVEQIIERTKLMIGPFRIFPSLDIRDIGYDSNVYQAPGGEIRPLSDYTATVGVGFNVNVLHKNWLILSVSENPQYVHYFNVSNLRAWNNRLFSEIKLLAFNRFVLSGNYHKGKETMRPSSEFDIPVIVNSQGTEGSLFYETPRRTSFGLSWSVNSVQYDDILVPGEGDRIGQTLDREARSGRFEFYYEILRESLLFMSIGFLDYDFQFRESQWRNARSYEVLSGIVFPLVGSVTGTLSLGYRKFLPIEKGIRSFTGLIGHTNLEFRAGRFVLRSQYERDFQFSFADVNSYFIENRYGLGFSLYPTHFLRLDSDFLYGENVYPRPFRIIGPGGEPEELHRRDAIRIYTAGLIFRIIRNIGTGVMFEFWERTSNYEGRGRERWLIGGRITYAF